MAENLKTTHYANGTAIPYITNNATWVALGDNNTDDGYCFYNNNGASGPGSYGALYSWAAAMNKASSSTTIPSGVQGACPDGWHLPSDDEWKQLEMETGMTQAQADVFGSYRGTNEGSKLAGYASSWLNGNLKTNADFGISGFNTAGGGIRWYGDGSFTAGSEQGRYWTATENSGTFARIRTWGYVQTGIYRDARRKSNGFSVRCVRD